ncbi:DDE Tnp4 domain-containing protein [Plasmodiophora brassicae]
MASGEAAWFVEYASQLFHARPESYQKPAWKRKWKAHFGVSLRACLRVWLDIRGPRGLRRKHLLMALHMLQCYPSEEVAAPKFGVTAKTFRKWAWFVIERIAALDYIKWEDRFENWDRLVPSFSLDGTDCWVFEQTVFDRGDMSHKLNHAGLRYEVGCALGVSKIVHVAGGVPAGS